MGLRGGLFKDLRAKREALQGKWKRQVGTKETGAEAKLRIRMSACILHSGRRLVPAERGRLGKITPDLIQPALTVSAPIFRFTCKSAN